MVNRTKISKEIRRRTGGVGKTGNGTKVEDLKPKDWEQIPGTGGSPHNPPRFRLTAKAKKRQQTQFKLKQATEKEKVTKPAVKALYKGVKEGAPYARLTGAVRRGAEKTERERLRKAGSLDIGHPTTPVTRFDPWKEKATDVPTRPVGQRLPSETAPRRLLDPLYKAGGKVKKMRGGKLHNKKTKTIAYKHDGGQLVANLYDKEK